MGKRWFEIKAKANGEADISIFSDIGAFGVSARDFHAELKALGSRDQINIAISSDGGDVTEGFAIYNMLNRHPAHKVVTVEGLAASMASIIAMAGNEVVMPSNAMMMIHNPAGSIAGHSAEIASFAKALTIMRDNMAQAYMDRTGMTRAAVVKIMNEETWFSAKEAVAAGLADRIEKPRAMTGAVNLSKFNKVPAGMGRILKGAVMAKAKNRDDDFEGDEAPVKTAADIRAEVIAQNKEIRAICAIAGKPELAEGFIDEDKTVAEVIADLESTRAEAAKKAAADAAKGKGKPGPGAKAEEVSNHNNPGREGEPAAELDPSKVWGKWNSAGKRKVA